MVVGRSPLDTVLAPGRSDGLALVARWAPVAGGSVRGVRLRPGGSRARRAVPGVREGSFMKRTRRGRVRRVAKWVGLVVCLVLAGVWLSSRWWGVRRTAMTNGRWLNLEIGRGVFAYNEVESEGTSLTRKPEWSFRAPTPAMLIWRPSWFVGGVPRQRLLWLPLWIPLTALAVPTALLWWRDRRRARPGHCAACGYDLAGLAPGAPCPECGKGERVST